MLLHEEVGLVGREEVVVVLADELVPRMPEELFAGPVEADEPERLGVLDEHHVREVLDDRVEESLRPPKLGGGLEQGAVIGRFRAAVRRHGSGRRPASAGRATRDVGHPE